MDNSLHYLALNRQVGLKLEMDVIANNIANVNTTGFRREGLSFTEFVISASNESSVSMADTGARHILDRPGGLTETGGAFDLAIEGDGFFLLEGVGEQILTRAGAFQVSEFGVLASANGAPLLDAGGAQIPIAIDAKDIQVSADGTISADGNIVAQLAIVGADPTAMKRLGDTGFTVAEGDFEVIANPQVRQGALENSNVNPVHEMARMIEVTRAYEMAQSVIQDEDERVREAIQTLGENV